MKSKHQKPKSGVDLLRCLSGVGFGLGSVWQEESVRTRRRSAVSLAKIRRKTKTSVSWCCCWRRVRAGCAARQQAHGTIDWAPQAETSQFRAPVSRDRLGLLSYKIPLLFFFHLPKKVHFSFPRQMFFFFYVILLEELWNFGLKRNRREANVMYDLEFNAFLIIRSALLIRSLTHAHVVKHPNKKNDHHNLCLSFCSQFKHCSVDGLTE